VETTQHYKTKDILHVQRLLGHKNIQNTLIYIDLETKLFREVMGSRRALLMTSARLRGLIEAGFEFLTGKYADSGKLFRRRK
jgi:hypothetical protein